MHIFNRIFRKVHSENEADSKRYIWNWKIIKLCWKSFTESPAGKKIEINLYLDALKQNCRTQKDKNLKTNFFLKKKTYLLKKKIGLRTTEAWRKWNISKIIRENNFQTIVFYQVKLSFKNEGKINVHTNKIWEIPNTSPHWIKGN